MYKAHTKNKDFEIEFEADSNTKGTINGMPFGLDIIETGPNSLHLLKDSQSYIIDVLEVNHAEKKFVFKIQGCKYEVGIKDNIDTLLEQLGMSDTNAVTVNEVKAPMPGLVLDVLVRPGDTVAANDKLLVLEAMKMENNIVAPVAGVVKAVHCEQEQAVEKNALLISFE